MPHPSPNELNQVERPFIEQLRSMGWDAIEGDVHDPALTERATFRDVLLHGRLADALRRINLDDSGEEWLDDGRIAEAIGRIERLGPHRLLESNERATELLWKGVPVEGLPGWDDGREQTVQFIDWKHPERNDFLVVNQLKVEPPGNRPPVVPDLVLFVNGIPLVVVECKSPGSTAPMEEGITQLLRYQNRRDWLDGDEGYERLFHYNQFVVSTYFHQARVGTISAGYEHFLEWKDTSPVPTAEVAAALGKESLSSQETLVGGMLRPAHLLDLVRNFTLFKQAGPQRIKIVARYQQFRAVHSALDRLRTGETREEHGTTDQRGGVIWHTQGSGKSLTMVFLVRKMRTLPELRRFKVVVVTDRVDLEEQLRATAQLTGEPVRAADSTDDLKDALREPGAGLVFGKIQMYQERDESVTEVRYSDPRHRHTDVREAKLAAEESADERPVEERVLRLSDSPDFPELNRSEEILVLVDEAHRSHGSELHANLMQALPNCAKIGFTGTPILMGQKQRTHQIFGPFLDTYTIEQSERDGATVPILYEGRTADAHVVDGRDMDELFEDMFRERTAEELEAIKAKYATRGDVLEAPRLIEAKARDMLRHYVDTVMPNGFKAQVVAVSRKAAVLYQEKLEGAHAELIERVEALPPSQRDLTLEELEQHDEETQFLVRASRNLDTLRRLDVAAIISGSTNDPPAYRPWTERGQQKARIERFKRPLVHDDPAKRDGLAFLCVRTMLLTGFDAPVEQVMYLDRGIRSHELLQAIARVNRTAEGKEHGLVVDYYGVGNHLTEALAVYADEDMEGALVDIAEELPVLRDRHRRVLDFFRENGVTDLTDVTAAVEVLRSPRLRARFSVLLKQFLQTLNIVLPRPEAKPYLRDARLLGFINQTAANLYRDDQLNIAGAGPKVRQLIDDHIDATDARLRVPPISILDADFDRAVDARPTARTKASEMEHAARHHIRTHIPEDPVYYGRLSERLEEILQQFEDNWEQLVVALKELVREVRAGRTEDDDTGLDPRTQLPFLDVLAEEAADGDGELTEREREQLVALTVDLVEHIRQEIRLVDFWSNPQAQNVLRMDLMRRIDDAPDTLIPFERQEAVAGRLLEVARANRHKLADR